MKQQKIVLVAGAQGVSGRAALEHWAAHPTTKVYGLSRRSADASAGPAPGEHISVDLLDPQSLRARLREVQGVTHLVFAAYLPRDTPGERSRVNVALLENLLDVVEATSLESLEHITFYQGGKAYGADLGPFKTPAREDDPRLMPPNFYYDQEDLLRRRQKGQRWRWTALRPEAICGYGVGNPMNLAMVIGVYAVLSKALGLPLRFPGTREAYQALYQVTSADILAEATIWAGTTPAAANQIYNITNGDYFRWQHLWPRIAAMFEMDVADPVPLPLAAYMADKAALWEQLVRESHLLPIPFEQVAGWEFGDFIFHSGFDNISSTIKARTHGFHSCIDTEDMFRRFFCKLREQRVLPLL